MTKREVVHKCTKETEIALINERQLTMEKKIGEIHHAIVGNGKPGLRTEVDMAKGAIKFLQIIISVVIVVFTVISVVK